MFDGHTKAGLILKFAGDHQIHSVDPCADDVYLEWDNDSITLTVHFDYSSESAAQEIYWRLQEIIPKLRDDRR